MPNFNYVAVSDTGEMQSGRMSAASGAQVRAFLAARGLFVTRLRRVWWELDGKAEKPLRPTDLVSIGRELSTLLRGGVALPAALGLLAETLNGAAGAVLKRVQHAIEEGLSPAAAFAAQGRAFDLTFLQMVRLGEKTGDLAAALEKYAAYLRRETAIRAKVRHASYYPTVLLGVIAVAVSVLLLFSVPRFARMYEDLGAPLPPITDFLLRLSNNFPFVILLLLLIFGVITLYVKNGGLTRVLQRLPFVGTVSLVYERARVMRAFATLLESGMTAINALEATAGTLRGSAGDRLATAAAGIAAGQSLSRTLAETGLLTATGLRVIEVAQQTGTLPTQAAAIAEFYEEDLDDILARTLAIIEPVMILGMGLIVGAIVLAMYLPIFSLTAAIQ